MNRLLFACFATLIAAVVVVGLYVVGGPAQARMEKNDAERFREIQRLANDIHCADATAVLPDTFELPVSCRYATGRQRDQTDPLTGAPYSYRKLSDDSFEVCATFKLKELPGHMRGRESVLHRTGPIGCVRYDRVVGKGWIQAVVRG